MKEGGKILTLIVALAASCTQFHTHILTCTLENISLGGLAMSTLQDVHGTYRDRLLPA